MNEKKEYIERGAALETLKEVVYAELASDTDNNRANYIIGAIELIPAADVEPVVRGEWIEHYDECECPVCGETWNYCDNDTERFDCCPKCGARLVEHGKERETEPEMYRGYDAGRLEMAYELIAGAGITPDDLKKCVWNFELAAKIYAEELRRSVGEATLKLINGGMIEIELLNLPNHEPKGYEARCD